MVSSIERVDMVIPFFKGIKKEKLEKTFLVAPPLLLPKSFDAYKGEKIILLRNFAHYHWLNIDKGILTVGPSAANMAFCFAEALGCNPITLIGQDLSYGREGETHVKGMVYGDKQPEIDMSKMDTFRVKGNVDEHVVTTPIWYMMLKDYEKSVKSFKGECINATEGGAYIEGTKVMPLQEVITKHLLEKFNSYEIIRSRLVYPDPDRVSRDYDMTRNKLKDGVRELKRLEKECENEANAIENFLESLEINMETHEAEMSTFLNSLITRKDKIISDKTYYDILMHIMQAYLVNMEIRINAFPMYDVDKPALLKKEIIALHLELFLMNAEMIKKVRLLLNRHLRRLSKQMEKQKKSENGVTDGGNNE